MAALLLDFTIKLLTYLYSIYSDLIGAQQAKLKETQIVKKVWTFTVKKSLSKTLCQA